MARWGLLLAFLALVAAAALALTAVSAFAHAVDFNETKRLISSNVACDELADEQLEEIGEYYMEQMHPGDAHELMDRMMGGEGSEGLRQAHIQMAKVLYCGESYNGIMGYGMMGMGGMMGSAGSGMMGSGYGMMGSYYGSGSLAGLAGVLWLVILILLAVALSLLIVWLYRQVKRK